MTNAIRFLNETHDALPATAFRWRDRAGYMHPPESMRTTHLFYTLRMIWNHTMPKSMKVEPFKRYQFNPFYSPDYMRDGIIALGRELFKRDDLPPNLRAQLDFMASHFAPMNPLITKENDNEKDSSTRQPTDLNRLPRL